MNILVVASYHYQGSLYPTAIFMHDQMRAYIRAGHRVRAVVRIPWGKAAENGRRFGPPVWHEEVDGIDHVFVRQLSFSKYGIGHLNTWCADAAVKRHVRELLDGFSPDVIHAHAIGPNTSAAAIIRDWAGCPLVFTAHGETRCEEPWISAPERIAREANKADFVACVSSLLERQMHAVGVTAPIGTILNGFHVTACRDTGPRPPVSLNYTGWLQKLKKVDVTLQAFAELKKQFPDATFTITGSGVEEPALKALVNHLGLEDSVSFLGYLDNETAIHEMEKSRFFVMPSHPEGFGVVYLEAMAAGCVTIGTVGQGIADLIVSGVNGFLVPPDDSPAIADVITWCVSHPEEADQIAERGRQSAMALTWEKNAAQYIELFQALRKGN